MDNKPSDKKSKTMLIILGAAVIIIIIIIAALQSSKKDNQPTEENTNEASENVAPAGETAKPEGTGTTTEVNNALKDTKIVVPGANPITKENIVVTSSGEATKTDVPASSALAPQQTLAVSKESLPASVIKIDVSNETGFVPGSFTVKAGEAITVSLTNKDTGNSRTLAFTDPSLINVIIGTPPGETRAITFNAPKKAGTYSFIDGIPGHSGSGTMIVK